MNEVKIVWFFQCVSFIHIFVKEQSMTNKTGEKNQKSFALIKVPVIIFQKSAYILHKTVPMLILSYELQYCNICK